MNFLSCFKFCCSVVYALYANNIDIEGYVCTLNPAWIVTRSIINVYLCRKTHVEKKKKNKGQNDGWLSSRIDKNLRKERKLCRLCR